MVEVRREGAPPCPRRSPSLRGCIGCDPANLEAEPLDRAAGRGVSSVAVKHVLGHREIGLYRAPIDGDLGKVGRRLRAPRREVETEVETKEYPSRCAEPFSAPLRGAGARDVGVAEQRDWSWSASPFNPTPSMRKDFDRAPQ
jgi:hypothetical protein